MIALHDDGFAVLDRFCNPRELAELDAVAAELIARRTRGVAAMPALLWIRASDEERDAVDAAFVAKVASIGARCLGVDRVDVGLRLFVKPPERGAAVPWHQDEAYHDPELDEPQVNLWIPLAAVRESSGCLRVAPQSHRGPLLAHRAAASPLTLEIDAPAPRDTTALEIARGSMTIHDRRTLHSSGPNFSASQRTAVVFVCRAPAHRRATPLDAPWLAALRREAMQNIEVRA